MAAGEPGGGDVLLSTSRKSSLINNDVVLSVNDADNLLKKMNSVAAGEIIEVVPIDYSDDELNSDEDQYHGIPKPKSYASATKSFKNVDRRPLTRTLVAKVQTRITIVDVIVEIENANLAKDLEGVQLINRNSVIEIVMKSDGAKNYLLEKGLNINGFHHIFKKANPNRQPSRRTHVSVFGLPLEAKNTQIGKYFEQLGYGRHVITKPVMRRTPNEGVEYYSGILVAIMEDLVSPIPVYMDLIGYRVKTKHNGQIQTQERNVKVLNEKVNPPKDVDIVNNESVSVEMVSITENSTAVEEISTQNSDEMVSPIDENVNNVIDQVVVSGEDFKEVGKSRKKRKKRGDEIKSTLGDTGDSKRRNDEEKRVENDKIGIKNWYEDMVESGEIEEVEGKIT